MFLVDDDEPHVAQGREQRAAGAYDHARLAAADEVPLVVALALPHARMHDGHQVAEAATEARHGLGRERYLGHEHAGRAPGRQSRLDGLQVHLGLARARDAVHHHHVPARGRSRLVYDAQRLGLPGCEGGLGAGREGRRLNARRPAGRQAGGTRGRRLAERVDRHSAHPAAALHAHDALALQRLERRGHGAELGGQLRHAQLARAQGRHDGRLLDGVLARLEGAERRAGHHPAVVHLAHGRFLQPPIALARAHHARHAARRREQAHARRERRQVALGEPLGACGAFLVEVRLGQRAHDGLEPAQVDAGTRAARARAGILVLGAEAVMRFVRRFLGVRARPFRNCGIHLFERHHETHRLPVPERHQHGAAHQDGQLGCLRRRVFGHEVGVRRVERLRGDVQYDRCESHDAAVYRFPARAKPGSARMAPCSFEPLSP